MKTTWWRFPLAIIAFIACYRYGSFLLYYIIRFVVFFAPKRYRMNDFEIYISAITTSLYVGGFLADWLTLENHKIFCMVISIVSATILLLLAIVYFLPLAEVPLDYVVAFVPFGACVHLAVHFCKENAS